MEGYSRPAGPQPEHVLEVPRYWQSGDRFWQKKHWSMASMAARTMTTAIDTNVVVALWDKDSTLSLAAPTALEAAFNRGALVVSAPGFAELMAAPGHRDLGCLYSSGQGPVGSAPRAMLEYADSPSPLIARTR